MTQKLGQRLAAGGRELAHEAKSDRSVYALIAANLFAVAIALATGMTLRELMLVYWVQSVIIGLSFLIRMLSLERFSTEGLKMNDQPVAPTRSGKLMVAVFLAFHYGLFHAIYLMFLMLAPSAERANLSLLGYALCAAAFALSHGYSLLENIAHDRRGTPNIGTLMLLPYARVLPMHLTFLLGGTFYQSIAIFLVFCTLKTAADVVMHTVEHHVLRASRAEPGSQASVSSRTS